MGWCVVVLYSLFVVVSLGGGGVVCSSCVVVKNSSLVDVFEYLLSIFL